MRQTSRQAVMLSLALWITRSAAAPGTEPVKYTVKADALLQRLDVRACFEQALPIALTARNEHPARLLGAPALERGDDRRALQVRDSSLKLPVGGDSACVRYSVDLASIDGRRWRSGNWRTVDAIVLDPDLWLWHPEGGPEDTRLRVEFVLPPGYDISAPWTRIGKDGRTTTFEVDDRMAGWAASMAIGRFEVESIELPGGRLRYALLPGKPEADAAEMRRWVTTGGRALVSAYGRLPVPDAQLLVVPIGHGREPVPWGEVQRGGGDGAHLYVDQTRPAEELMGDWVLVHELGHLLHPNLASADRWLSEGIASYYQNILRARAGLTSAQSAWDELHAGFERGIRGTPKGRRLAQVSETMIRDRSFMRVYWSGAAIALLADVELRRRSGGAQSLDTALAVFSDCCLPAKRTWSAREVMQKLDELTGMSVLMELYRTYVDSDRFPDLGAAYARLGLEPVSETALRLDPAPPKAAIRKAIMSAAQGWGQRCAEQRP